VHGYPAFGATAPKIAFNFGPAWTECMREEIAKGKAHPGTANTARCTQLIGQSAAGGIPLAYYLVGAAALVGGSAWYFFFRKPKPKTA
jgi:hypothetical protein